MNSSAGHRLLRRPTQRRRVERWTNYTNAAGKTSIARMHNAYANAELIHLPVHASWLNQAELFFSIVQRKALTPNDLATLPELARRLMDADTSTSCA